MILAVTAPSGHVGRFVVRDLVLAGTRPRVLAHRPDSLAPELRPHVDLRVVDLADQDALTDALQGVDGLYLVVPSLPADDPIAAYDRLGAVAAAAVAGAGVPGVVFQSSGGAEKRHGVGEIDGLARVEEHLDATGAAITHLRCGYFFTNLLLMLDQLRDGVIPVLLPTDRLMPWVAPIDIAHVVALRLLRGDWSGREVRGVHGPADLSWDDAARVITETTGHHVRAEQLPDDQMRAALHSAGLNHHQVEAIVGMSTGIRDDFQPEQPRDVTTTTFTTLAAWSWDNLRPALRTHEG